MHDNTLTQENRDKFIWLAEWYSQIVKFYNVEELCAEKIEEVYKHFPTVDKNRFTIGMFYRLLIPFVLPSELKKAIYLDGDTIVNLDINELWQIELADKPFGAVPNFFQREDKKAVVERTKRNIKICKDGFVKPEDYFNSGVLLLNLRFMRHADKILLSGMKFLNEHDQLQYLDQDVLNYCFSTSFLKLPVKFNRFVMTARPENELTIEEKIYHYAGGAAGLGLNMSDPFNRLWMSYFVKAPWFDADAIGRLYENFLRLIPSLNSYELIKTI